MAKAANPVSISPFASSTKKLVTWDQLWRIVGVGALLILNERLNRRQVLVVVGSLDAGCAVPQTHA
ncbi:hypothetical protein [Streptomyces spinoverrucosus]|uniref:hypothetical protein n=1 Tax=Streptomyces spinoverrucosus TaxID=284043 RepID=UPI0011436FB2|nr:hypothetical protein [Streptomyces spinoverrucosus]